tara:strand:+ start:404 stop:505 length:102 start_codon:yes stop_codon:yes gene_type:complete
MLGVVVELRGSVLLVVLLVEVAVVELEETKVLE